MSNFLLVANFFKRELLAQNVNKRSWTMSSGPVILKVSCHLNQSKTTIIINL